MNEGLLWYNKNPQHGLGETIRQAAGRFEVRFGRRPTVCYLNAADVDNRTAEINRILVRSAPHILRHHLWLGVEHGSSDTTNDTSNSKFG